MNYNPSTNLLSALRSLFPLEICPWDDYYPRMAQTDFLCKRHNLKASKTFFIRKAPFGGAYAILGGLTAFLRILEDYRFDEEVCYALKDQGYRVDFIKFLQKKQRLNLTVYSGEEGSIFFPNEPAIVFEGSLLDVRFAEGILLKNVNFPTLQITKWQRVCQAAAPGKVMEFARRRAQDDLRVSLYANLAGANLTSNSEIRRGADIKVVGTMGHEWIQSFGDEFEAFDKWLEFNPDRPVLLVDTIDTLKSGIPNAIKAFKKHWDRIKKAGAVPGVRNDSGDLAYITIEERKMFDQAGLNEVCIFETNDLDEYSIETIRQQIFTFAPRAGLDPEEALKKIVWACGTQPGTCSDQPSLGGVAKLSSIERDGAERPVIKLAKDNPIKTSIPGSNRSAFVLGKNSNELLCCLIHGKNEKLEDTVKAVHPDDEAKFILYYDKEVKYLPRQKIVFDKYKIKVNPEIQDVQNLIAKEVAMLHWTNKRFQSPHLVKVSLTEDLFDLRQRLIENNDLIDLE
jgi:nicotinate phosphoribosyltransferase